MQKYLRSAFIHDINEFISPNARKPESICRTEVWDTVVRLLCVKFRRKEDEKLVGY